MPHHAPRWVLPGGVALCAIAGQANAVGLLGVYHEAISHVTGTATHAAAAVARGDTVAAVVAGSIVVAFAVGAVIAGALVHGGEVHSGRRYSVALVLEGALFVVAWGLLSRGLHAGEHVAAIAAGLQNGLATRVSGAIVRTTHITGLVTDIGLTVGAVLRGRPLDRERLILQSALVGGFVAGGVVGALAFGSLGASALLLPALQCLVLAFVALPVTLARPDPSA
jgi:uncharacterized membrane protein YoaK (UPF0700 family)